MFRFIKFIGLVLLIGRSIPTATETSTAPATRITTPEPTSTSHSALSAVTEPTSTTQSRTPAPSVSSTMLISTAQSSISTAPISAALPTRTPTSTSQLTTEVISTTQPASQTTSSSPDAVPQTFAYAAFQLRSSVELSNDQILKYIEKFVKHFQANLKAQLEISENANFSLIALKVNVPPSLQSPSKATPPERTYAQRAEYQRHH